MRTTWLIAASALIACACRTQLLLITDGGADAASSRGPGVGDGATLSDAATDDASAVSDAATSTDASAQALDLSMKSPFDLAMTGEDGGPPMDLSVRRAADGAILPTPDLASAHDLATPPPPQPPFLTSQPATWPTTVYDGSSNVTTKYVASNDATTKLGGVATRELKSTSSATLNDCGYNLQAADSLGPWIGHRVRMTGELKTTLGAESYAGLFFEVYGPSTDYQYDDMSNRRVFGTTSFTTYELVLDVNSEAISVSFGGLLCGTGAIWIGPASFQVVDDSVPSTATAHNP